MKRKVYRHVFLLMPFLFSGFVANAEDFSTADTTFMYNNKTIKVSDDDKGQVNVKVYEGNPSDSSEYKQLYEGIYSDGKSYEKYTVVQDLGFRFPNIGKKHNYDNEKMEGHWAGFAFGLSNIVNDDYGFTSFDGAGINSGKSFEWTWNTNEFTMPLYRDILGITTGFGMTWRNYYMDEPRQIMKEIDDVVVITDETYGAINKSARLRTLHLNIPLLLEIQPTICGNHDFFLSAGVVGGLKAFSNFKVKYEDADGDAHVKKTAGGLNMPLLTLDYMVQAGVKDWSLFAKYSPFDMFRKGEGPDVHTASIGLMLNF